MIKMHCDRCDRADDIRWTKGTEKGEPIVPEGWGEVRAPEGPASLAIYVLCQNCLSDLHVWIKDYGKEDESDIELFKKVRTDDAAVPLAGSKD